MKAIPFVKLAVARPRAAGAAGIAAAALAACGVIAAPSGAQADYNFFTINDPADIPPPAGAGGQTFTTLMGITSNAETIPGFFGSGAAGDPNTGFVLTLPGKTFTPDNATFPLLSPPLKNPPQTQITSVSGNGTTFTGYTYPTNLGVQFDFQFGFYEQGGVFTMVNNPKTPNCSAMPDPCASGVITENQLIGVNNANLAVGFYNDALGVSHGYTYNIPTGTFSADIDDPNASKTLGGTVTAAINNSDEIAGFYTDSGGVIHGFIDNGGVFTTVDPTGSTETELLGLNDNGIADGFADIGGMQHGILYDSLTKMFTILDPMGSTATTLNGINDAGDVVGFFVDGMENTDGLLGTPVPEPDTWVMMLTALAGLGYFGLRRSRKVAHAAA